MTQEIESIRPALSVILDDGDFLINSTGEVGKKMLQAVLPLTAAAKRVTVISDGDMKVMKRNAQAQNQAQPQPQQPKVSQAPAPARPKVFAGEAPEPDVQDQFVSDLESGRTGEAAMGEKATPTPGPNDPVATPEPPADKQPPKRAVPRIYQDAAAPPAPELVEQEMDRLLAEAAQAEKEAARVAEDRRFQAQQAVQAGEDPEQVAEAEPAARQPRRRRERQLATSGRPCGRCGGAGQVVGDAGFAGACPVCHGEGQVKTWDRSLKIR